ncbi:MAG: biotin-dependent carboxyltransferase family protein [Bacteroidia bacterium]|nr:biotin-dependent carboxyltransferase family protein [Bacteroidia bacterium]
MIRVVHPGLYSSIQDQGRSGQQEYGVPVSGVMDAFSASLANTLVGNQQGEAVIEMTLQGPKLRFESPAMVSVVGANFTPVINGHLNHMNRAFNLKEGDLLSFERPTRGIRAYIAIAGGLNVDDVMGSKSMFAGITNQSRLQKNDCISIKNVKRDSITRNAGIKMKDRMTQQILHVYEGPEFELLTDLQKEAIMATNFTISNENNRMAYQLIERIPNKLPELITSMVMPGTVQLTPAGKIIILMRDCQTTGGYPRILQLSEESINLLAQKFSQDTIRFSLKNYM